MKSIFRSKANKVPASIEPGFAEQPKKLIYRAQTFDYIPRHVVGYPKNLTDCPTVTLIYLGNTYKRKIPFPKPYQKPRAINWRWQYE